VIEEDRPHLGNIKRQFLALLGDQDSREARRMTDRELVEDVRIRAGEIRDSRTGF
jgi:hypothetical protein